VKEYWQKYKQHQYQFYIYTFTYSLDEVSKLNILMYIMISQPYFIFYYDKHLNIIIPEWLNTSHQFNFEDFSLVGCDAMQSGTYLPMFWRNVLPHLQSRRISWAWEKWCGYREKEYQCPERISKWKKKDDMNKRHFNGCFPRAERVGNIMALSEPVGGTWKSEETEKGSISRAEWMGEMI
jgi:hypothetical protein